MYDMTKKRKFIKGYGIKQHVTSLWTILGTQFTGYKLQVNCVGI